MTKASTPFYLLLATALTGSLFLSCQEYTQLPRQVAAQAEKIAELEEIVETQQGLIHRLTKENDQLGYQIANFEPVVAPEEKKVASPAIIPESSKKKLFIMRIKLNNYNLKYNKYPETINELKGVLDTVEVEDRSGTNTVHLSKNGKGGWYYDPDEGYLDFNTYKIKAQ